MTQITPANRHKYDFVEEEVKKTKYMFSRISMTPYVSG
jgi:hypothetical protein